MRDGERQRVLVPGAHVNEMNIEAVDLGEELRERVELRFALAPIVLCCPVPRERLRGRELDALSCIRDCFALGPLRRFDTPAQIGQLLVRILYPKGTNVGVLLTASFDFGHHTGHGVNSPGETEKTKLTRSNACRGSGNKAAAIEGGHV